MASPASMAARRVLSAASHAGHEGGSGVCKVLNSSHIVLYSLSALLPAPFVLSWASGFNINRGLWKVGSLPLTFIKCLCSAVFRPVRWLTNVSYCNWGASVLHVRAWDKEPRLSHWNLNWIISVLELLCYLVMLVLWCTQALITQGHTEPLSLI